ncbi:kinase-like domain-containing protein [Rhizophagus clarus]|uniref:Kinase-like domain-containing protein n=1 Tax=Rhizophagus clarus TaxID=94130 RepID=A0A8H3M6P1_9GLOM|nr:kinase-like domain-containing protein [Rhizophagus clarus]
MTTNTNNKNNKWVQWIKDGIANEYINYYDYDDFQNIECIGSGGFEIVNEIILMQKVRFHANIIQFFGLTSNSSDMETNYLFILEYADNGTLKNYLNYNFNKLDWNFKLQFAIQIADAVSCIHQNDIVHNDLIKLADFGLSRRSGVTNSVINVFGKLPYIDPQHFRKQTNKNDKKSDVYSVGVLLWEISSGRQPFESYDSFHAQVALTLDILNGKREIPIFGTPVDYINIYTKCWQHNTDDRPDIHQVFSDLSNLCINKNILLTRGNTNTSEKNTMQKTNIDNNSLDALIIYYPSQIYDQQSSDNLQEISMTVSNYAPSQEDNESNRNKRMHIDSTLDFNATRDNTSDTTANLQLASSSTFREVCSVAQNFDEFIPLMDKFLSLGDEVILLYERAKHNKELCGFLLKKCNCAMAAVKYLDIRKTANTDFFSKENLQLFKEFVEYFNDIIQEFDGYMRSLNFSFVISSGDEITKIRNDISQIKIMLFNVYDVPDDRQSLIEFSNRMSQLTIKNMNFQSATEDPELEANEPLLDGKQYHKTHILTKKIEKRTLFCRCEEFCFKEFSNNSPPPNQSQIEIRRQVNILKELKDSDHIIRFFGVAHEDSKYYLVTEWMEYGNLYEYYTNYKEMIDWSTKIKFALNICRGVAYLHECKILHHDIQSTNILVNSDRKVKIANFGLSMMMIITTTIMQKKKKVSYNSKCEIYSVGTLLWEIADLKKPHSDLNNADMLVSIRKRVSERYSLPFSDDTPVEWRYVVGRAMEYEPTWRLNITDICRDFYNLSKKYQHKSNLYDSSIFNFEFAEGFDKPILIDDDDDPSNQNTTITFLSVDNAIRENKSMNGNKKLAWDSFKFHSLTNFEAKYWLGYYYYHDKEIPELQQIDKKERIKTALEIFKETADKGNPSAQLRYGICLWQGDGVATNSFEALRYLKLAAESGNSAAMYIVGKVYWNGGNGVEKNKKLGAEYLRKAALNDPKAREMCIENKII